jgi:sugar phosphate isomerase/epimerase
MHEKKNTFSRRRFITQTGMVTGGILIFNSLPACDSPGKKIMSKPGSGIKFGLVTYLWGKDWDLPTLIRNCEEAGLFGVELRTTHAHAVEPNLSKQEREEVKKRFADSPVSVVGIGSNEMYDNPDPEILEKSIEATKAFIELSYDVGGSGVKVKPNSFHENVPHEKTIEQIGNSLNILGKYAAEFDQQIRLEVHGECAQLPTIKSIMDIASHPNVAVCWNSNNEDLEGKGLEYNFNLVKDRFGDTAHVRELNIGEYPYQKLINLFVDMDYKGWILLEARTDPEEPVKAMKEQLGIFNKMIAHAQSTVSKKVSQL